MTKMKITGTEIRWMINALNRDIASIKEEMDHSEEDSPIWAFGEVAIEGRESLRNRLVDFMDSDSKTISVMK